MMDGKINYEELNIAKEIPLLIKLRLKKLFNRRIKKKGNILIINTCIIGDFVSTLPALSLFIKKNKMNIDMIVSSPVKTLAEKIKGVNRVFTSKSAYNRSIEQNNQDGPIPYEYEKVIIMRISPESYNQIKTIKCSKILIYDIQFFKFFFHLVKNILLKKPVKQWREINFEILNLKEPLKKIRFEEIFDFNKDDYSEIKKIKELSGKEKKIIIHTGSGWKMKLWGNENWIKLLKMINNEGNFKFIFIGSTNEEQKSFEYIQKNLDFEIFSIINKADLKNLLCIMKTSHYFIGIDSGPRNMAHLADLRSISLLGPGIKDFMPWDKKDIVIDKSEYKGTSLFYFHKKSCMEKIIPTEVFDGFKKLLNLNS